MSRSQRLFHGVFFGYIYQALVLVTGLWLTPFLLRHLGEHDYGLWLMGLQVLSYLLLTDLGVIALLPRTIAYATGRAGEQKAAVDLPSIIGQTATLVLYQTVAVGLAASLIWRFLPDKWFALRGPIGLVMAGITVLFPMRIFPAVLEGLQEQGFAIRASMLGWAVSTIANVLCVLAGFGLYSLAIGLVVSQVFTGAGCWYRIWTRYRHVLPSRLPGLRLHDAFFRLGRGFWISASQIGQLLMGGADILVLGKVLGPARTVPYSCTGKLAGVLSNQPQLLMQAAIPGLSELKAGGSKERLYEVTVSLAQGMMLISGLMFCLISVVNEGFVKWWVGPSRYAGFGLTCLILLQVTLRHLGLTFMYTGFCYGYERRISITSLVDGMVSATAIWILTPRFGYLGAAAGSIIGVCLVTLPANLGILAKELDMPVIRLFAPLWPWFWRFVLLAGACLAVARSWTPVTVVQMLLSGMAVGLVYLCVFVRPTMRTPLGPVLRHLVASFFSRFEKPRPDLVVK